MCGLEQHFYRQLQWLALIGIIVLMMYAYRALFARPFVADDYQWLLNVYHLDLHNLIRESFQVSEQDHFYRPIMWLVLWGQVQWFGLDPTGYHLVSVLLHLVNAALLGSLVWRLGCHWSGALLATGFAALHPALFEAVVWVSAQSELIAACLLLLMLHMGMSHIHVMSHLPTPASLNQDEITHQPTGMSNLSVHSTNLFAYPVKYGAAAALPFICGATLTLGLALLTKETAIIGLPLLLLLGGAFFSQQHTSPWEWVRSVRHFALYILPIIVVGVYVVLQVAVVQRNYLVQEGGYSLGWQIILNPARSLALVVTPLPGTEHADALWLIPVGGLVGMALLVMLIRGPWALRYAILALLITLTPTAPFTSPPDSRYLYLPVFAAGLLLATYSSFVQSSNKRTHNSRLLSGTVQRWLLPVVIIIVALWSAGEVAAREGRFAAASGPGGSLWHLTSSVCTADRPARVVVVDPPLATVHADAIVRLACGPGVKPKIVTRDQAADEVGNRTVVLHFPQGSAEIDLRTY